MEDADMFLGGPKGLENLQSLHPWNPKKPNQNNVVIRDSSLNSNTDNDNDNGTNFSIFPPSNHKNLTPFNPQPPSPSSSPLSVSLVPRWWGFAHRILRAEIANFGSYVVGRGGGGNVRAFWQFGNVGLAAVAVVMWWLCVRVRRRWRRKENVGHFLKIIREKDEMIIQLLNQIAQMNELLLACHKAMTSKLSD